MGTHPRHRGGCGVIGHGGPGGTGSCALLCSPGRGRDENAQSTYCGEKKSTLKIRVSSTEVGGGSGVKSSRVPLVLWMKRVMDVTV